MTAADFAREGVRFTRSAAGLRIQGPKGRADIATALREEISRRVPMLATMPPSRGYGTCDGCGDALPAHRGGFCDLCSAARERAVRSGARP